MTEVFRELPLLQARLRRLERRARLYRAGLALLLVAASTGLLAAATTGRADTVEATKFILKDAAGRTVMKWDTGPNGPRMFFYAEDGNSRVGIILDKGNPSLTLNTGESTRVALVSADEDETGLVLKRRNVVRMASVITKSGDAVLTLKDNGKAKCYLIDSDDYTGLGLRGPNRKANAGFAVLKTGPVVELIDDDGKRVFARPEK